MDTFTFNSTLLPSAKDLLLAFPRLASRAGIFAISHIPDAVVDIKDVLFYGSGSVIADATGQRVVSNISISNTSALLAQKTAAAISQGTFSAWAQSREEAAASMFGMLLHGIGKLKDLGGVFSYLTSRWALATFTAAVILNRAQFYASSREHLRLKWFVRLAIYIIPILAFVYQMIAILQTLKCQTSPDFAQFRYDDASKQLPMDFGGEGGFLYHLSSTLLWWKDDLECCKAQRMSFAYKEGTDFKGSMSLLFRFFLTLCASQLFDTLACALQGRQPVPETGMTIFEHSLAFAECEAMVSSALGLGFFGLRLDNEGPATPPSETVMMITRGEVLQRLNIPPEVLLVCLISCFSHLSSASLAIAGIREKVRLVNTGLWACCYMSAFLWSFFRIFSQPIQNITDLGVLRFPTVCIVGFIPHVLILTGIILCALIYGAALLLTALSVPDNFAGGMTFKQRLDWAYRNLQANVQFSQSSSIRIKMSEDFYTTILKIGFNVLTAASEAVYLNEGARVQIAKSTWLERKRLDELADNIERRRAPIVPSELLGDGIARGVDYIDSSSQLATSPYARERKSKQRAGENARAHSIEVDSGLGLTQRKSRIQLTFDFVVGIFWLNMSLCASILLSALQWVGIHYRPAWLLRATGVHEQQAKTASSLASDRLEGDNLYVHGPDGKLYKTTDRNVDVEVELRKHYRVQGKHDGEEQLSEAIYRWWSTGYWFGDLDNSEDYTPTEIDDDTTSVISMSTNASEDQWSDIDDGVRTPTQHNFGRMSRESTPANDGVDAETLARLLNPQTHADQEEARMLSHALSSKQPLTRSRYRRTLDLQRAQVVHGSKLSKSAPEEEEHQLERFILEQRSKAQSREAAAGSWATGAEGMGETGPQCVVCQSTPRTILVWPCGCLSMCDDCRVGLAARNFTKCICCRTDIAAYSRLFVP